MSCEGSLLMATLSDASNIWWVMDKLLSCYWLCKKLYTLYSHIKVSYSEGGQCCLTQSRDDEDGSLLWSCHQGIACNHPLKL